MLQYVRRSRWTIASLKETDFAQRRAKSSRERDAARVKISRATRIEINRGIALLGPGVDGNVRLLKKQDARDTLGSKGVHQRADDFCPREFGTCTQNLLETRDVVERKGIGAPQV